MTAEATKQFDCRSAGISEICYQRCPTYDFARVDAIVASAFCDMGIAAQLAEHRRQMVEKNAKEEIARARALIDTALAHDGQGPWTPDFQNFQKGLCTNGLSMRTNLFAVAPEE